LESPTIHYRLTAESVEAKNHVSQQTFALRVKQQAKSGAGRKKGRPLIAIAPSGSSR
jgi:hypothetical protein